jgi:ParB-like chromosome segregation protein Spo0J
MVSLDKIKLDPTNPNVMSDEQMEGLRESMRRFGYLEPVIVDQDYLVADGEHRLTVYREFGRQDVPCYVLDLKDEERRLLRQTMNKLRGSHDIQRDAAELKVLFDGDRLDDLAKLVAGSCPDGH